MRNAYTIVRLLFDNHASKAAYFKSGRSEFRKVNGLLDSSYPQPDNEQPGTHGKAHESYREVLKTMTALAKNEEDKNALYKITILKLG